MKTDTLPEPLIIPRADHSISRKNIDREALKVMYRLKDTGFLAYLVGGGVRDLLLGKTPKDFDISTDARPGQIRKIFRNSRIIGRRFRLVQVFFHGGKIVEVSTLRRRSEYDVNGEEKVLASNNTFGTPAEDAFRRDLTINALFYEIENFAVIDYTGGMADLNAHIIKIVGDPDKRISRDPVRMMRVIRHAARTGFMIEENTWQAIKTHRSELSVCPVSRIRDELLKDLRGGASRSWARFAIDSGLFFVFFPCYKGRKTNSSQDMFEELLNLFAVVDRLQSGGERLLPDFMLLALMLLPWARVEMDLLSTSRSRDAYKLSRAIRAELDENLAHLDIKRAAKEAISGLLANLPVFQTHASGRSWPKKLQRKSYFQDGLLFYQIYCEAKGGKPVVKIPAHMALKHTQKAKKRPKRRRSSRTPLLAKTKGGIFGLKK